MQVMIGMRKPTTKKQLGGFIPPFVFKLAAL
jgi:hypothetical protein